MIYHLALRSEWDGVSEYRRSTIDKSLEEVGFIHCSYEGQVQATADMFYAGRDDVMLLTIDPSLVSGEIRVEDGFPHIYGPLSPSAVVSSVRFERGPAGNE